MADKYANWAALVADTNPDGSPVNVEGRDYIIQVRPGSGTYLLHLAIHGGSIEPPPQQLADYASHLKYPFYTFAGIKPSGNADLHITSTHFDEPQALAQATAADRIVSWHGHADRTAGVAVTYVGGLDTELGGAIQARLIAAGFNCQPPPSDLSGTEPANITNRSLRGAGVQIEMSRTQREAFFAGGNLARSAIENPVNRTAAFYRYVGAVNQGIADVLGEPDPGDMRFNLTAPATAVMPPTQLDQPRVHQQTAFEEKTGQLFVTQVIANGVTLPGESGPPPTGMRDSRGDLAISRVSLDGVLTGAMYVRSFDHGSGLGVEYADDAVYLWIAYDAIQQPIGTNAHGRRIARLPFQNGAVIDPTSPSIQDYNPIPGASSITPGLDAAHGHMAIAYSTGSGTRYRIYDLAQFRAHDFTAPLAEFARPSYPDFQSWQIFDGYVYQLHGTAYGADNPPPPAGDGNVWFTVIDASNGTVVQRVHDVHAPSLSYREPESLTFRNLPDGPQLVFGFATSETSPRLMNLYSISALVQAGVTITAEAVTEPDPGVQLTVSLADATGIGTWAIYRVVQGTEQLLFNGTGNTLGDGSVWMDTAPPGCIPLTYRVEIQRTNGQADEDTSNSVTYVPPGGCSQGGQAVGEQDNTLGCAETYSAVIHWRGGAQPYPAASMERLTEVSWGRTINDISEGSVTVLKGNISPDCCVALGKAEPWVHELSIYRDADLVWQGPIISTTARRESITINAVDVFAWFDKLVNTWRVTYTAATADAAGRKAAPITYVAWNHIRLNLTDSTLSVPSDYPGIMDYIVRRDTGLPTIKVEKDGSTDTAIWTEYLGNMLREWAKRGLTWTTIGRRLLLRGKPTTNTRAMGRLTLDDFAGEVEVIKDGTNAATYGFATTQDTQDISDGKSLGTGRTGTAYGRLDILVKIDEEKVTDNDLRGAAHDAIAGRSPVPLTISIPDGSTLTTTAPVRMEQLVPGERFDVLADAYCTPIVQGFMLSDLDVSWQQGAEKVAISLVPLADVDEELT